MRHARWMISLCVLAVIVFTALCARVLFSVCDVYVSFDVSGSSEVEKAEAIVNEYKGSMLPFLNADKLEERLKTETKLEVAAVEKRYPNGLYVKLRERRECFAVTAGSGYWILDEDYTVIERRDTLKNSYDELDNVLLIFGNSEFNANVLGERKRLDVGNGALLDAVVSMLSELDSPRDYLKNVRVEEREAGKNYYVYFTTLEGVCIEIRKALEKPAEKLAAGIAKYSALEDADRLGAKIAVYELDTGEITAVFTTQDNGVTNETE